TVGVDISKHLLARREQRICLALEPNDQSQRPSAGNRSAAAAHERRLTIERSASGSRRRGIAVALRQEYREQYANHDDAADDQQLIEIAALRLLESRGA